MADHLELVPMTLKDATAFVGRVHRHHAPPRGGLWAVGIAMDDQVVGAAIVGRPVSRMLQDGWTAEVLRVAVIEGVRNGCSMLYGACW